jgi:hypothetical protein
MNFSPLFHAGGTGWFDEIILGIEALLALLVVIYFIRMRSARQKNPPPQESPNTEEARNTNDGGQV